MPQYAILTYSLAPADPMALTPDYAGLLERYPAQVEELPGRPRNGGGATRIALGGDSAGGGSRRPSVQILARLDRDATILDLHVAGVRSGHGGA
jgi:hypothetical protein